MATAMPGTGTTTPVPGTGTTTAVPGTCTCKLLLGKHPFSNRQAAIQGTADPHAETLKVIMHIIIIIIIIIITSSIRES